MKHACNWTIKSCSILLLTAALWSGMTMPGFCAAEGTFSSLREAKQNAWQHYCESDDPAGTEASPDTAKEETEPILMIGAVSREGTAKLVINDWEQAGVPAGEEIPFFSDEKCSEEAGSVPADAIVQVLSTGSRSVQIGMGALTGYVHLKDLLIGTDAEQKADEAVKKVAVSEYSNVILHESAAETSENLCLIDMMQDYDIEDSTEGFLYVDAGENKGWVSTQFVQEAYLTHVPYYAKDEAAPQASYTVYEFADTERNMLAALAYTEGGSEPFEGQKAIITVVLNRMEDKEFPDTVREVIFETGQFDVVDNGDMMRAYMHPGEIPVSCFEAADCILQGQNQDVSYLYFDQSGKGQKIGVHYFH